MIGHPLSRARAELAVRRDRQVDEPGVQDRELAVPDAPRVHLARQLAFDHLIAGHGPVHHDRARIGQFRNYIEELTRLVETGKKAGKPLAELQKTLTMASFKRLQANGYASYVAGNMEKFTVYLGQKTALEERLAANIKDVYNNLDRV